MPMHTNAQVSTHAKALEENIVASADMTGIDGLEEHPRGIR